MWVGWLPGVYSAIMDIGTNIQCWNFIKMNGWWKEEKYDGS